LLNRNISCKNHTAEILLAAPRFSQALLQEPFTSKWWFSSKLEPRKFILKTHFLKLVNSKKMDFLFSGLDLNIIIQKKAPEKMHVLWMMLQQ